MICIVCGGNHKPSAAICDSEAANTMGARQWNTLTAHVSRINNAGPMVPWELKCEQTPCTAPECICPPVADKKCDCGVVCQDRRDGCRYRFEVAR
jgi:hypothetical protein